MEKGGEERRGEGGREGEEKAMGIGKGEKGMGCGERA